MSDVVLQTQRSLTALEPQAANSVPGAHSESLTLEEEAAAWEVEGDRLNCTAILDQGCLAVSLRADTRTLLPHSSREKMTQV